MMERLHVNAVSEIVSDMHVFGDGAAIVVRRLVILNTGEFRR